MMDKERVLWRLRKDKDKIDKLESQNAALLEALEAVDDAYNNNSSAHEVGTALRDCYHLVEEAIQKASR